MVGRLMVLAGIEGESLVSKIPFADAQSPS